MMVSQTFFGCKFLIYLEKVKDPLPEISYRLKVVKEMYETECSYISSLQTLIDVRPFFNRFRGILRCFLGVYDKTKTRLSDHE